MHRLPALLLLTLLVVPLFPAIGIPQASPPEYELTPELRAHGAVVLLIDPETGRIVDANDSAADFYGYPLQRLRGMRIQEINALVPEEVEAEYRRARAEERDYFIFPHRLATGEVRTVEVYSSPFAASGRRTLLLSIIHDATDKWQVERELLDYKKRLEELVAVRTQEVLAAHQRGDRIVIIGLSLFFLLALVLCRRHQRVLFFRRQLEHEQERKALLERFEYLTRHANDIILLINENGEIVEANERAEIAYGYSREELLRMNIQALRVAEQSPPYEAVQERAYRENGFIYEAVNRRRDGELFPVESSVRLIRIKDKPFFQHITRDITERRRAEEARQNSERQFRLLVDNAPEAIFIHAHGLFAYVNKACLELYGARHSFELLGKSVLTIVSPGFHPLVRERIRLLTEEHCTLAPIEQKHLRLDGSAIDVEVSGVPLRFEGYDGALIFVRDITERKLRELHQEELMQTDKMATLGVLVASVAHEVNNPNNFILVNASHLETAWNDALSVLDRHSQDDPDFELAGLPYPEMRAHVTSMLSGIRDGSRRIKRIVEELGRFSRKESLDISAKVDLNAVVQAALGILQRTIAQHTDRLSLFLAADPPMIRGDFQKLEQVVINLLLNACQALPDKQRSLCLETVHLADQRSVALRITDHGEGIAPENVERIWEPFFSTRTKHGGTGLGLPIVAAIITKHHGRISVNSLPGAGTTVTVLFNAES
ncbi:PAS domain S-box-containing protein [Desulfonatronum zhilinae]|nr:PAS domain S-box-containing protein [Desulfonatronum zhilinae]